MMNIGHHQVDPPVKMKINLIVWLCCLAIAYPAAVGADSLNSSAAERHKPTQPIKKSIAHLYFANSNATFLSAEKRLLVHPDTAADYGKQIVIALLKGPKEGLIKTIPPETRLRAFFLTTDGIAYVDLTEEITSRHPGGCYTELLTIFSIVNSLTLNVAEISRVQLLVDGSERSTLAGHIDIRYPIQADMMIVR